MSTMFRRKRGDTTIASIEATYGITLNARADMKLGNLLRDRGFDSLTQLLVAYRGNLPSPAAPRRVFLSFHAEDLRQVNGLRLMIANPRLDLEFLDEPTRDPVGSERSSYIKQVLRGRIARVDIVVCLIGNGTAWRDWVDWELRTGIEYRRGVCGVRLKGSRGRAPSLLHDIGAPVASWDRTAIISAIECAAARRS